MVNKDGANPEKTIMVIHNQQSVDMSLFASGLALADHSNTKRPAVINYNGGKTSGYVEDVRGYLNDMGTDYVS